MRPSRSSRSKKATLPCPRRAVSRPATRTTVSDSSPEPSASLTARTEAILTRPGNSRGKGSIPRARNAAALARRSATRRSSPESGRRAASGRSGGCVTRLNLHDLVLDHATRCRDDHLLTLLAPQDRLPNRALVRKATVLRIGLGGSDDCIRDGLFGLRVLERHARTDRDIVGRNVFGIDDPRVAQLLLEHLNSALDLRLLVLGVVVLRVLGD